MKTYLKVAAGLLTGAALMFSAAPAMARVHVDVVVPFPGIYLPPPPVFAAPRVVVQPAPYYDNGYYYDGYRGGGYYRHGYYRGRGYYRDRDGDGVPNRYDRAPNNPWR